MKSISCFLFLLGTVAPNVASRLDEDSSLHSRNIKAARRISCCTGEAAKALFTPSNDITIVMANRFHHPHLLQDMLRKTFSHRAVKIFTNVRTDPDQQPHRSSRESSFVLIETHIDGHRLLEDPSIERWAEYIIVTEESLQWLAEFADHLWNIGFVKVAFVHVAPNGFSTLIRPVQDPTSRGSIPTLRAFDLCKKNQIVNTALPEEINQQSGLTVHPFSSMLHTPTKGTLKFAKVLESGNFFTRFTSDGRRTSLGIDILQMFATKFNIQLVQYDWKDQDVVTWTDAMHRCVAGECDFFYARELPPKNCCHHVEPIGWYTLETLVFVDSRKSSLRTLSGLLMPYRGLVWLCTFVLLGAFAVFAWVIETLWYRSLVSERITVLQICSVFVGQTLPVLPTKFSLRFVLGMWIVYNLNSNLLYTGTFSSALTAYHNTDILTTFDDILESGRPICGTKKAKQILNDTKVPLIHSIIDRLETVSEVDIFSKILNENYIGAHHSTYVSLHNWNNRGNSSLQLYRISGAFIAKYPLSIFAKKRNPFNDGFNKMVSNLREAGVNAYLVDRFYNFRFAKSSEETPLATSDGPFLTLKHLQVVFYILFVGHLVSGVVFLLEIHFPK